MTAPSTVRQFCTSFDRNYAVRGLTLRRSLLRHAGPFTLWVLCLDRFTYDLLGELDLPDIRRVSLGELERSDPGYWAVRERRTLIEYYFTSSPVWPLHLLVENPGLESVTYLDADLFFYSDPDPIFAEMGDASVLIVPHRFPDSALWKEQFGIYNVSLLSFRQDERARACLRSWRKRCLEWCHDRVEPGRYGDQKYLDDWPERFEGVHVLRHPGAGLAPWNWMNHHIELDSESPTVDGLPLIFYHFQGLRIFHRRFYDLGTPVSERLPQRLRAGLYEPYIEALEETAGWLRREVPGCDIRLEDERHLRRSIIGVGKTMFSAVASRIPR